jgi:hypothetical protein
LGTSKWNGGKGQNAEANMKTVLLSFTLLVATVGAQVMTSIPKASMPLVPFYESSRQTNVKNKLSAPAAIAVGPSGNVYVFDDGNSRIVKLDRAGRFLTEFGQPGNGTEQVERGNLSDAIAVDRNENIYVLDAVHPKIQVFDSQGTFVRNFRVPFPPSAIAINSKGEVFLAADSGRFTSLIFVFSSEGKFIRRFGETLIRRAGTLAQTVNQTVIACDSMDNLWVAFRSWPVVRKYSAEGKLLAENQFQIPSQLVSAEQAKNYSLDFFAANPDSSFTVPLLSHSISVSRSGEAYILLNGDSIVAVNPNGRVAREWGFQPPHTNGNVFIRLVAGPSLNEAYLLDIRSSAIYRVPKL